MISDATFRVLGSGTSAGVPVIGCDCNVCTSDDPRDSRLRTSACIEFVDASGAERVVLIDTSPDLRQQALTHGITRCDGILFTHNHVDHTYGLDEVRRFNVVMQDSIDVFGDEHTITSLHRVFEHIFRAERNVNRSSFVASLIPHVVTPDEFVDRHGLRCTPLPLLHGRLPLYGWRFDVVDPGSGEPLPGRDQPGPFPLAWCTDVSAIPPSTWGKLTGLRTLFLDMLRERAHPTHFTLDQAVDAASRIGAEQTCFIHMTHDLGHAETDARLPDGMRLAFDGMTVR